MEAKYQERQLKLKNDEPLKFLQHFDGKIRFIKLSK